MTYAPRVAEYFAGIGLARIGMERAGFDVLWSNDISAAKAALFSGHFGESESHQFDLGDLRTVSTLSMPAEFEVAWASFPCTDLSLAGARGGLHTGASSAFWLFIKNIAELGSRKPRFIVLENVTGFASSKSGRDIAAAVRSLNGLGYSVDILSIDARRFVPQSRPRLFLVADRFPVDEPEAESDLRPAWLSSIFSDPLLRTHKTVLPAAPKMKSDGFTILADVFPVDDPVWWTSERLHAFTESLSPIQKTRLGTLQAGATVTRRTAFRRMREGVPRWEIRADDIAGCLRTAKGGSSKQAVIEAGDGQIRARWMTTSEYAKLMGAPEYAISGPAGSAYSGFGDAVCVPVVEWIAKNYLGPLLAGTMLAEEPVYGMQRLMPASA